MKYEKLSALQLQLHDTIQSYENIYAVNKNDAVFEIIEEKKKTLAKVDFELNMMRRNQEIG